MNKLSGKTPDIAEANIAALRQLFPEIACEDKIDFDKLKQLLGEYVDDSKERYNFSWNGKGKALRLSQTPSMGTLRPCKEESKNWDSTQNLYIEGDNLEVLKLLQKSYHNKVKMIYIDPPYNTGGDFVYPDNFTDSIEHYKQITGQVDGEGKRMSTNTEASGRYHTDWLNMIYPRLRLARNLLTDDGVIFISIDDNEQANLKKLCDEVFGEENCIGEVIRKTKSMTGDDGCGYNRQHESLFIYVKNALSVQLLGERKILTGYSNPDNDCRGTWVSGDPSAKSGSEGTSFEIINPYTGKIDFPPQGRFWAFNRQSMEKYITEGKIKFKKEHSDSERGFIFKRYETELRSQFNPLHSLFAIENPYMNQRATVELRNIIDADLFSYPKPLIFLNRIISSSVKKDSLILDFFSGSATTAHAVMQLNAEDGGNRKFIMVQLPEETNEKSEAYKAGYTNIAEIGKERIRRAGEQIKAELVAKQSKQITLESADKAIDPESLDIGFKVFKLDSSNLKKWHPDYDKLEQSLLDSIENYVDGRTELDMVYEILIKLGLDLTYPIDEKTIGDKHVYSVGFGALMMCLDNDITTDVATGMVELYNAEKPETWKVVFKDNGFKSDSVKTNIKEIFKLAGLDEDSFTR